MSKATKIRVHKGDITKLKVDAIVNAANEELYGGAGVCGAIFDAAGYDAMSEACNAIGGCETGKAVITPGFNLPAKHVIHAVGPIYKDGKSNEAERLKSAYSESLKLAEKNGIKSIAFPLISTGIYGFPKNDATQIAVDAINNYLKTSKNPPGEVIICVLSDRDFAVTDVAIRYCNKAKKPPRGWDRFIDFADEIEIIDPDEESKDE